LQLALHINFCNAENRKLTTSDQDTAFASNLSLKAKTYALKAIKRQWLFLQKLLKQKEENLDVQLSKQELSLKEGSVLQIFVSSSMSENLLRSYAQQAKKYNATLIFRGLPSGSWKELAALIQKICAKDAKGKSINAAFQIDDPAFEKFDIKVVPTIVLSMDQNILDNQLDSQIDNQTLKFDKVAGAISINQALKLFASGGELSDIATSILDNTHD
jgi:type-F conjugative transfer system pilin assembly protein TrbC